MSTLGKIVTIFVVLASVALAAMNVTFVRSTKDWRGEAKSAKSVITKQQGVIRVLQAAVKARNNEIADASSRHLSERSELKKSIADLVGEKAVLDVAVRDARKAKADTDASVASLTTSLKVVQDEKDAQEASRLAAITDAKLSKDSVQALSKAKFNLMIRVADLEKKLRMAEQTVAEQDKALAFFRERFPGDLPTVVEVPSHDLIGVIRNVKSNVAEISLGTSDGVRTGQLFSVSRGSTFLATLKITRVDDNSAVGQLGLIKGEVQEGDDATYQLRR